MITLILTKKGKEYLKEIIISDIQNLYDDPYDLTSEKLKELLDIMKTLCKKLDINFEQILIEETTDYERKRIQELLKEKINE